MSRGHASRWLDLAWTMLGLAKYQGDDWALVDFTVDRRTSYEPATVHAAYGWSGRTLRIDAALASHDGRTRVRLLYPPVREFAW